MVLLPVGVCVCVFSVSILAVQASKWQWRVYLLGQGETSGHTVAREAEQRARPALRTVAASILHLNRSCRKAAEDEVCTCEGT